jgi:hypothetical protein
MLQPHVIFPANHDGIFPANHVGIILADHVGIFPADHNGTKIIPFLGGGIPNIPDTGMQYLSNCLYLSEVYPQTL